MAKRMVGIQSKYLLSLLFMLNSNVFAFQVPASYESKEIEIGSCTGYSVHYEYSGGTGIGNAFAFLATPVNFDNQVNPHYDGSTPGIPYSSGTDLTSVTPADILSQCGVANAVLTITGVATGPYASEDLIGYKLEGKDPSNGNAQTLWEVAVSGVTNTQTIAKKNSVLVQPDYGSGTAGTPISPLDVLANDNTDGAQSTLTNSVLTVVSSASNSGVVLDVATGLITTTADVPSGSYSITYQLCNAAVPTLCAQATATVTLDAAPVVPPEINDAAFTTPINTSVSGAADAGGQVPAGARYEVVGAPTSGQLTIDPTTGAFTYTPNSGFTGTDISTIRVCLADPNVTVCDDATLTFTVQGGAVGTATPVPTLGEWSLMGLTLLLALFGASRMRERRV